MNVVDSSGWLEYFAGGRNASHFAAPLKAVETLVVPAISIYEVFKVLLREAGEDTALQGALAMQRAHIVDELTPRLAMSAASLSIEYSLPMANSVILASARAHKATIWTQDIDFRGIDGVKYFPKE
uniref:Predicted nucleic acid-binding protein, contains PIN domain n=1 Tax=Candidatus Kentrum sp. FW TaxID=2126338 RepID=A0A450SYB1_9GAMM|nr:MAG: Predicted nucleic acid-binding protein, contains PIN domain [Candidatus Kentron sp. FW]